MAQMIERYPELKVYKNDLKIPDGLYRTDPDRCCGLLKVEPTSRVIKKMGATCWVTGLRCTEGRTRTQITTNGNGRSGRWVGTSKCGGECGIHTRRLKENVDGGEI